MWLKKLSGVTFLILSMLLVYPLPSFANSEFDYSNKEFQSTVKMLSMEGHAKDDLATCTVKQKYYEEVAEMFQKGMSKQDVLQYYIDQLGEEALAAPLQSGFSLSAYWIPFFVILLASVILVLFIRKWVTATLRMSKKRSDPKEWEVRVRNEVARTLIEEERKKYF